MKPVVVGLMLGFAMQSLSAACPSGQMRDGHCAVGAKPAAKPMTRAATPMPPPLECPPGTHAWADSNGNPICQGMNTLMQASDGPLDCPEGTRLTIDSEGTKSCRVM
jgi:hypothetical protein